MILRLYSRQNQSSTNLRISKLLAVERAKAFKDFGNSCFGQSSLSSVYDDLRKQAAALAKLGKQGEEFRN
jgi:hypothetical protein